LEFLIEGRVAARAHSAFEVLEEVGLVRGVAFGAVAVVEPALLGGELLGVHLDRLDFAAVGDEGHVVSGDALGVVGLDRVLHQVAPDQVLHEL